MAYVLNSNVIRCGSNLGSARRCGVGSGNGVGGGLCANLCSEPRCGNCPFSGDLMDFVCELRMLKNRSIVLHVYDADLIVILLDVACDSVRVLDPATGNIITIRVDRILYFEETTLPTTTP